MKVNSLYLTVRRPREHNLRLGIKLPIQEFLNLDPLLFQEPIKTNIINRIFFLFLKLFSNVSE